MYHENDLREIHDMYSKFGDWPPKKSDFSFTEKELDDIAEEIYNRLYGEEEISNI